MLVRLRHHHHICHLHWDGSWKDQSDNDLPIFLVLCCYPKQDLCIALNHQRNAQIQAKNSNVTLFPCTPVYSPLSAATDTFLRLPNSFFGKILTSCFANHWTMRRNDLIDKYLKSRYPQLRRSWPTSRSAWRPTSGASAFSPTFSSLASPPMVETLIRLGIMVMILLVIMVVMIWMINV